MEQSENTETFDDEEEEQIDPVAQAEAETFLDQEDYQNQVDDMEDNADLAESVEWSEVPEKRKQESLYNLFQKVWKAPDSSKVANLTNVELGRPIINVRDAQYLALLAHTFKHPRFAQFFTNTAEITLSTSASKKGWFTELFVSQKKFTSRSVGSGGGYSGSGDSSGKKKKWTLFGGGNQNKSENYQ